MLAWERMISNRCVDFRKSKLGKTFDRFQKLDCKNSLSQAASDNEASKSSFRSCSSLQAISFSFESKLKLFEKWVRSFPVARPLLTLRYNLLELGNYISDHGRQRNLEIRVFMSIEVFLFSRI